jgi:tyrosine-protein kinase Etk/Wzc
MRGYLAETAPEFQRARSELAVLREQLARREAVNVAGVQGDYVKRFREFNYQETVFELFSRQYEVARIEESREGAVIRIIDAAQPVDRKSKPRRTMVVLLTLFGTGLLSLVAALARRGLSKTRLKPGNDLLLDQLRISVKQAFGISR